MDFARKQLEKYGWTEGKGLGKKEDGIATALKPKLKFDNSGVGHSVGEQFTNNWWEKVFNNASSNIRVENGEDGVKVNLNSSDSVEISTKSYSVKELKKNNNLQYGSFLKTSKITENGMEHYDVNVPEQSANFTTLTDDELFAACGGRTAHKGARHGLKLNGKLARIEKQEKMLLKKMRSVSLDDDKSNLEKKMKKLKKHREESSCIQETDLSSSSSSTIKKKNKKKRKSVSFCEETVVKYYTPDLDNSFESTPSSKDENSNDSFNDPCYSGCDEGIEYDLDENDSNKLIDDNNHKSFEELQRNFNDLSKAERKKLKKKRKHEKKTHAATNKFIEEVFLTDQNKKRKCVPEDVEMENILQISSKRSKKKKMGQEKKKKIDKKMMKSIVQSLDHICKISDDE